MTKDDEKDIELIKDGPFTVAVEKEVDPNTARKEGLLDAIHQFTTNKRKGIKTYKARVRVRK